jgi:glycosyltransferase involved in cell wall biosynthesis
MCVSVLILTLNEEINLADCLSSVAWSDDVVVLDSYSSDATVEIATRHGARVVQRQFDDYAAQRNFGLQGIAYRHSWVLMVDADERVTAELRGEIEQALRAPAEDVSLFYLRRRDHLFGRWLRHSSGYPTWFGRLIRLGRVSVERPINELYRSDGSTGRLQGHLEHYPFNKGFSGWLAKHDRYSSMEAELMLRQPRRPWRGADLLAADPQRRRAALKNLVYALPGRPLLMFLALYLVRGGVLEGRAGLTFCLLRAWYEFMIDCKHRELLRRRQGLPV